MDELDLIFFSNTFYSRSHLPTNEQVQIVLYIFFLFVEITNLLYEGKCKVAVCRGKCVANIRSSGAREKWGRNIRSVMRGKSMINIRAPLVRSNVGGNIRSFLT